MQKTIHHFKVIISLFNIIMIINLIIFDIFRFRNLLFFSFFPGISATFIFLLFWVLTTFTTLFFLHCKIVFLSIFHFLRFIIYCNHFLLRLIPPFISLNHYFKFTIQLFLYLKVIISIILF